MKINHKLSYAVITVAFAVAAIVVLNMAFAATSSVQVESNNIEADARTVDITLDNGTALSTPLEITPPDYTTVTDGGADHSATIDGHMLEISSSDAVRVRAWVVMNPASSWLIIDSAYIFIGATTAEIQSGDTLYLANGNTASPSDKDAVLYIVNDKGNYIQATATQITASKILYTDQGCTVLASASDIGNTEVPLYVEGGETATLNDRKAAVYHFEGNDVYTQAQSGQRTGVETLYNREAFAITPAHDQSNRSAGTPTASFELPDGNYPLLIKVVFTAQYTAEYDGETSVKPMSVSMYNTLRSAFSGQLVFAAGDEEPLPAIQNP